MNTSKNAMFGLMAIVTVFGAVFAAPAQAVAIENSVSIDAPVLSRCGEQFVAFSGTASYNNGNHQLLIDLDGTPVYDSPDEPVTWSFLHKVSVGTHALTTRVHDNNVNKTVDDAITFEVKACDTGGGDIEPDCCPGPDPVVVTPTSTSKPTVKGATSRSTANSSLTDLEPLNGVFRSVFGRTPTFTEWKYWADRFLTDKPAWDQILGAMQWHNLLGLTTGKRPA